MTDNVRRYTKEELRQELQRRQRQAEETPKPVFQHPTAPQDHHAAIANAYELRQFTQQSFSYIYKGMTFVNNWHIDAITELLQAATLGQVRKFIINIPRRCSKSTLLCVCWLAWEWTFLPHTKWLFNSYDKKFAKRDNSLTAALVKSEWYQHHFSGSFHVTKDNAEQLENSKGGYRYIFGMGGGTGQGGDRIICDDPNNIEKAESVADTEKVINGFREVAYSNYINPKTVVRGIIQQRTSDFDLTGDLTKDLHDYEHLVLPMEFDEKHPLVNSTSKPFNFGTVDKYDQEKFPELEIGDPKLFIDPRSKAAKSFPNSWFRFWYEKFYKPKIENCEKCGGECKLLWTGRLDHAEVDDMTKELGLFASAGQMQQDPTVRGGTYLKVDAFSYISYQELLEKTNNLDECELVLYIDKGGTENAGDPTAGLLMLRGIARPYRYYILHYFSEQVNYANRLELTQSKFDEYKEELQETNFSDIEIWQEQERNSSAKNIREIEEEDFEGYPINFDMPRGNTQTRAKLVSKLLERERYVIVKGWLADSWIKPYTSELGKYNPKRKKQPDEAVDVTSGATRCVQRQGRTRGRLFSKRER